MALPDVDQVPELALASDGEHELEILRAQETFSQRGETYFRPTFAILDEGDVEDFSTVLMYPTGMDQKMDARRARRLRSFMAAFGIPAQAEPEDMIGQVGKAILRTKDAYSGEGQENDIRIFV